MSESAARTYRNACREARWCGVLWLLNLSWTIGYVYLYGYSHSPDSWPVQQGIVNARSVNDPVAMVAGIPWWILGGVVIPWLLMAVINILIACFVMADDDLGETPAEEQTHGH